MDRFPLLPMPSLVAMLEGIRKSKQEAANAHSVTTAYLLSTVRAIAGNKDEFDPRTVLPYPPDDGLKMTLETAAVLRDLFESDQLPMVIIQSMGKHFDAITK